MTVTMAQVAEAAGVSKTTVSHVINESRAVSPEARRRVLQAVTDLNYQVNRVARNLRSGNSHVIGFIVTNLSNIFFVDVGTGLDSVLKPEGYRLFYVNSYETLEHEKLNLFDMVMHSADGLVIAPTHNDCGYMNDVIPNSLPTVFIDRKPKNFQRDSVLTTNQRGVYEAVRGLLEKGHRRIGFVGSRNNDTMYERLLGYHQALREAGVQLDESLVHIGEYQPTPMYELLGGQLYQDMDRFFRIATPTAIMAANGLATVGIISFLKNRRIRVPDEIALISFDDHFSFSMLSPTISAVVENPYEIGVNAGRLLLRRIRGEDLPFEELRVATEFVQRESS